MNNLSAIISFDLFGEITVTLNLLDWSIVLAVFAFVMISAFRTKKYGNTTADFLAANRCAGRYMLTIAAGIAGLGAITIVSAWQQIYKIGFASNWWGNIGAPLGLIIMISGYGIYRYRETRVLTLGQLLEIRYSRRFRILAGSICFFSGLLNYAIFPAVGANFIIYYCGIPQSYYPLIVIFLTLSSLSVALFSGQIAVIITDFFQSTFVNLVLLFILVLILIKFPLSDVFDGLLIAEPGKSRVNPFDSGQSDFNPLFFFIGMGASLLNVVAWQGMSGYQVSATSPHEQKMAGVIGNFKSWSLWTIMTLIPIVAYMIMNHPGYAESAKKVTEMLSTIENAQIRDQMTVPVTMLLYMPPGLIGAFAAVMIVAFISTNDTYMHSWGSIFIQDLLSPMLKKPLSSRMHLIALRLSITAVALFAIIFSCIYRQTMHIAYFLAITGALWLGGCGAVIVGGLYTSWGNTRGAYAALISGSLLAATGLALDQIWKSLYDKNFFLTGQEIWGIAMVVSIAAYTIFSLVGRKHKFNLDKMLHRGKYSIESDHTKAQVESTTAKLRFKSLFGITKEFTFGDKVIYAATIAQSALLWIIFLVLTPIALFTKFTDKHWCTYHFYYFWFSIICAVIIVFWVTIGGFRDLFRFYKALAKAKRDVKDDGRVEDHDYTISNE